MTQNSVQIKFSGICLMVALLLLFVFAWFSHNWEMSQETIRYVEEIGPNYFAKEELNKFLNGWTDDKNERFLSYIRSCWLVVRSHGPLNISHKYEHVVDFSQEGQSTFVDELLNHKRNGFFIECGAADGVTFSNTLFFERKRSWTGLLVEANNQMFEKLQNVNRNAYSSNSCLSTRKSTQQVSFRPVGLLGGIGDEMDAVHSKWIENLPGHDTTVTAQCFTLHSLLLAVGQTEVGYFSLDVEGPELEILRTIPFHKISIKVITIEYRVYGHHMESLKKLEKIRKFFKSLGIYKEAGILPTSVNGNKQTEERDGLDVIFVRI